MKVYTILDKYLFETIFDKNLSHIIIENNKRNLHDDMYFYSIESNTFSYLNNAQIIEFPDSISYFGYKCFENLPNLEKIIIHRSISPTYKICLKSTSIYNCPKLKEITIPEFNINISVNYNNTTKFSDFIINKYSNYLNSVGVKAYFNIT